MIALRQYAEKSTINLTCTTNVYNVLSVAKVWNTESPSRCGVNKR